MKTSNYFLSVVFFLSTIIAFANPNALKIEKEDTVTSKIETYLSTVKFCYKAETVTIFSDFLLMENDYLMTVDFMVTEDGEIEVLSKEYEEEYYKVDSYSTQEMKKYSYPVALANSGLIKV